MVYMATLAVEVPDDVMEQFRALAETECRSPEGEALWLIKQAVDAAGRREFHLARHSQDVRTLTERLASAQPLFAELKTLHLLAGGLSSRAIAKTVTHKTARKITHTTVNQALTGKHVPSWPVLESIVKVLDGDAEHYRALWVQARGGGQ